MADILTLSAYKAAKGITSNEYDTQLNALIPMINSYIEKYCNRTFGPGEFTERREGIINNKSAYVFNVQNKPIVSVQEVNLSFIGTNQTVGVDTTRLDIFHKAGYMYYSHQLTPPVVVIREEYRQNFYYDITYSGGDAVPPPVTWAAVQMLSDTWEYYNRTNTMTASGSQQVGELKSVKIGDYTETYATGDTVYNTALRANKGGVTLTQTVRDILTPYRAQGQSW